jgi:hypothetical protein
MEYQLVEPFSDMPSKHKALSSNPSRAKTEKRVVNNILTFCWWDVCVCMCVLLGIELRVSKLSFKGSLHTSTLDNSLAVSFNAKNELNTTQQLHFWSFI